MHLIMTKVMFTGIVVAIFVQRLIEVQISQRHQAALLARGGREHGDNQLPLVKGLQLLWFGAMLVEVWGFDRPFVPGVAAIAVLASSIGQLLRYLSMRALGVRWTLPIITLPGAPAVNSGIYRYLRHPNWLGVILEITAVPLIHSAYVTAIAFTLANAWLMRQRIQSEERALAQDNNYMAVFAHRLRFIPVGDRLKKN
jgi:methyltransferase